jgi:hypothetical protein
VGAAKVTKMRGELGLAKIRSSIPGIPRLNLLNIKVLVVERQGIWLACQFKAQRKTRVGPEHFL